MAKAVSKKRKSGTKTRIKKTTVKKSGAKKEVKVERALADNFIALQKVMVNLSAKFDSLSMQIAKLLELFEISAKALAQKDAVSDKENKDTKKILEKLDNLSQQAGLIGKGLTLIHEVNSEKGMVSQGERQARPRPIQSPPRNQQPTQQRPFRPRPQPGRGMQGYQKSISSRIPEEHA